MSIIDRPFSGCSSNLTDWSSEKSSVQIIVSSHRLDTYRQADVRQFEISRFRVRAMDMLVDFIDN